MTYPFKGQDLINKHKTWRTVICINPDHATVQFDTNDIGNIQCPICESTMVTLVRSVLNIVREKT